VNLWICGFESRGPARTLEGGDEDGDGDGDKDGVVNNVFCPSSPFTTRR
jgi:hypothetical protein